MTNLTTKQKKAKERMKPINNVKSFWKQTKCLGVAIPGYSCKVATTGVFGVMDFFPPCPKHSFSNPGSEQK